MKLFPGRPGQSCVAFISSRIATVIQVAEINLRNHNGFNEPFAVSLDGGGGSGIHYSLQI